LGVIVGTHPSAIRAGDWDEDGHVDLAVSTTSSSTDYFPTVLSVVTGDGHGGFSRARHFSPVGFLSAAADFDEDGHQDLATADSSSYAVIVVEGDGFGNFAKPTVFGGTGGGSVVAGDVDEDGHVDLVATEFAEARVAYEIVSLINRSF